MKLSIVISILNSHEVVRRQMLYLKKMNLADDIEIIFVDDGSNPPLTDIYGLKNLTIYYTNDKRPWTQPIARNTGVKIAKADYVCCTDIDHILSEHLIETSCNSTTDVIRFKREFGILDEEGIFTQNKEILKLYGLPENRIKTRGLKISPHSNSYTIRKSLFLKLGGSREDRIMNYPNRDETPLKAKLKYLWKRGKITIDEYRPTIYMFPVGHFCGDINYNPFNLFHTLNRGSHIPSGMAK